MDQSNATEVPTAGSEHAIRRDCFGHSAREITHCQWPPLEQRQESLTTGCFSAAPFGAIQQSVVTADNQHLAAVADDSAPASWPWLPWAEPLRCIGQAFVSRCPLNANACTVADRLLRQLKLAQHVMGRSKHGSSMCWAAPDSAARPGD